MYWVCFLGIHHLLRNIGVLHLFQKTTMFKPSSFICVTTNFSSISRKYSHGTTTNFKFCIQQHIICSLLFSCCHIQISHKSQATCGQYHETINTHFVLLIIVDEWCTFSAFSSLHTIFILKWMTLDVKKFKSTVKADKKKQCKWAHIKQNKTHLTTCGVILNRIGQTIWHNLPTIWLLHA